MSDNIVLGYWGIRGRGQVTRNILAYTGLSFEEKIYAKPEEYFGEKFSLGLDFPNLPYLIDGDIKISESDAIPRHVIRRSGKLDLLGKTPQDQAFVDSFISAFWNDYVNPLVVMPFNKNVLSLKTPHYYKNKSKFEKLEKFLSSKKYVMGYLTLADFYVAEGSFYFQLLYPEEYGKFKGMNAIRELIENLPEVQAYYQRPAHIKALLLPPNFTKIPCYYPGMEPKQPPPPPVLSPTKSKQSKTEKKPEQKPVPPPEQKKEEKVASSPQKEESIEGVVEPYQPAKPMTVVLVSGSLSGNAPINYLMNGLSGLGHPAFNFQWADISSLEMHNEDIEEEGRENANNLRGQLYEADAVLIGVSETNGGVSAVLTNAHNWMTAVIKDKPVGLVSIENTQDKFRVMLDKGGCKYMKEPMLAVKGETFFDGEGSISGKSLAISTNFLNRWAKFIEEKK